MENEALKLRLAKLTCGRFLAARSHGNLHEALAYVEREGRHWVGRDQIVAAVKAGVSDVDLDDVPGTMRPISEAFLQTLRPLSVPGRLNLRSVPMRTRIFTNTSRTLAAEVAEHQPIPVL